MSDTVRHRRSRTPQSSSKPTTPIPAGANETAADAAANIVSNMPDLLPKTFHLAESSSLFSQINEDSGSSSSPWTVTEAPPGLGNDADREQTVSVVEIRESNLSSPKKAINTYRDGGTPMAVDDDDDATATELLQRPKVGEIINTINLLLESADYFEPECVEVHIIDATSETSDTDTGCSTPNMDAGDESDEYETGELPPPPPSPPLPSDHLTVERTRISFREHKQALSKDRDLLRDSEQIGDERRNGQSTALASSSSSSSRKKFTPTLKEILSLTERDSFYDSDIKRHDDEPLVFSDDDDHRQPMTVLTSILLIQPTPPNINIIYITTYSPKSGKRNRFLCVCVCKMILKFMCVLSLPPFSHLLYVHIKYVRPFKSSENFAPNSSKISN